ncbi:DNA mismatch repair protein MLH3 [Iris pallida]|uniref:DNA mismatch repair protein MLH3 n=1 Tax=Iris pallida TaxID=29817 RepID=A0AAX6EKU7_IRIPA|nr:DNA mismatch repair protein MLH3 [Iris pallida]
MNSIRGLQPSVRDSLRSSIVLFDLPRIVEELVYNSVDSGATEVHVSLSVSECQVKVEDDGCGITRDGLVILGERYATSKIDVMVDKQTNTESFGFRGETLASLSDVSLVEVRTKARGRPNAYCKIMKGSKCLFFGIDDQREAVGTSIIVRDLFHNQPVRRNYMETSPKRVLHTTKKCVLRIALVHPQVSFKVIDVDSEDELLCTIPSSCPLSLVLDGFGDEVSRSLHKIVFSDKMLMLSGYMSGLSKAFSTKAFQYIYINSRFVCKGPIHNLINSLASIRAQRKAEPECQSRKRHKTQGYPAYLLNLCCPITSYDLYFEPSKNIVEFKEWSPILSFFEQAIKHFWEQFSEDLLEGNNSVHDSKVSTDSGVQKEERFTTEMLMECKMKREKCNLQLSPNITPHSQITNSPDLSLEDITVYKKDGILAKYMKISPVLKRCQSSVNNFSKPDYSSQHVIHDAFDAFASGQDQMDHSNNIFQQWVSDVGPSKLDTCFFSNQTLKLENKGNKMVLENDLPVGSGRLREESHGRLLSHPYEFISDCDRIKLPLASPCASSELDTEVSFFMGSRKCHSAQYPKHRRVGFVFNKGERSFCLDDDVDTMEPEFHTESLVGDTFFHAKADVLSPSIRKCHIVGELDESLFDQMNPFSFEEPFGMRKNLHQGLASEVCLSSPKCVSPEVEWYLDSSDMFLARKLTQGHTSRGDFRGKSDGSRYYGTATKIENLSSLMDTPEVLPASYKKSRLDYQYCPNPKRCPTGGTSIGNLGSSSTADDEKDWSLLESSNIKSTDIYDDEFEISVQIPVELAKNKCDKQKIRVYRQPNVCKVISKRSSSAPPFYKGKHKFPVLKTAGQVSTLHSSHDAETSPDGLSEAFASQPLLRPNFNGANQPFFRESIDLAETNGTQSFGRLDKEIHDQSSLSNAIEGSVAGELECASVTITKWRTSVTQPTSGDVSDYYPQINDEILNVCSGVLHLSSSSLVPQSIDRECLQDARVLLQLDTKFIPVVAGGVLIVIDQHAADERIRLEELRRKVLSEEGISIAYLESEKELVLPEMGFQLLQKYAEQIKKWGWICSIHSQSSESFAKKMNLLKKHACGVTLVAVPCILGTKLTDKDLIEFIDQLVETDGSSTIPPAVLRVLNNKACRGAIMFGDSLLPSECSLIVEELKATSLCFQCAHGRPTAVPLLNMASLHEQLAKLEMEKGGPGESWHGLRRHAPSIERAQLRMESAKRFRGGIKSALA